jgi:hypothetical protein
MQMNFLQCVERVWKCDEKVLRNVEKCGKQHSIYVGERCDSFYVFLHYASECGKIVGSGTQGVYEFALSPTPRIPRFVELPSHDQTLSPAITYLYRLAIMHPQQGQKECPEP